MQECYNDLYKLNYKLHFYFFYKKREIINFY